MALPTQAEVNAAARNIASFAGGIILAFGLSSKISPDTVQTIITSTGNVVNDIITLIGIITPLVAAWYAKQSATPAAQVNAVQNMALKGKRPAQIALLNAASNVPGTAKVVNPLFAPDPATTSKVTIQ